MSNRFLAKLARENLKRNLNAYLPYAISVAVISALFFMILNTVLSGGVKNMPDGATAMAVLLFGCIVMVIFIFGFMVYLNKFLIKRRKMEFGLYGVLGLEKRHIGRIVRTENNILNFSSLAGGLVLGTVFGKLAYWLLIRLTDFSTDARFTLSVPAYLCTVVFFSFIFLFNSIYNRFQVGRTNAIDLLHGDKKGEKKLRFMPLWAVLGLLFTGAGYSMSIFCVHPGVAIGLFWPAVLCVILGNGLLFLAGSQLILTAIKKSPAYYKPRNFITVSGLIHRMKQNASGLSTICLLSTMVLVTISLVCSLYFGLEREVGSRNPDDLIITSYIKESLPSDPEMAEQALLNYAKELQVDIEGHYSFTSFGRSSMRLINGIPTRHRGDEYAAYYDYDSLYPAFAVTLEDFNRISGTDYTLEPGHIMAVSGLELADFAEMPVSDGFYSVDRVISEGPFAEGANSKQSHIVFVIEGTKEAWDFANRLSGSDVIITPRLKTVVNVSEQSENYREFMINAAERYVSVLPEITSWEMDSSYRTRTSSYAAYGGLMFIGIFFSLLFIIVAVLVMYFKQLSEGYDDRERFAIMRKVGLDEKEIKTTINRQLLLMFFAPLAVACLHTFAASNIMSLMVECLTMGATGFSSQLTLIVAGISSVIYALAYMVAYRLTAKAYYRIIK